ncbi:transporter substrate-binding domain-containing protein [uncultured Flavonifractor sp.]|uniref:transporter substrate-binding domain-containing protein n=1 Tax=uncultured Flavonifractor sp. TaxID=1193534 RepID=UPI00262F9C38|nr:transporter substrate-binding domain-containing protein [uncultured Flavonifractor sp.]
MLLIVLALAITLVAAGCSNSTPSGENSTPPVTSSESPAAGDGSLQRVLDAGKLVVACETAWPPFAYMDGDQKLVGYDVEVAAEVAKRLGVEIEYSSSNSWDGIVASLDSKRVDAIFNGVNIAGRVGKYAMTIPYMQNQLVLTVAADNDEIKSFEDLDGKVVANALEGSNGKLAKSYGATLTPAGIADAMMLLKDHRADAQIEDQIVMALYLEGKPEMKQYVKQVAYYEPEDITEMQVAGMFRIEDHDLVEAVNEALQEMKEDGTLYNLAVKYLSQEVADSLDVFTQ